MTEQDKKDIEKIYQLNKDLMNATNTLFELLDQIERDPNHPAYPAIISMGQHGAEISKHLSLMSGHIGVLYRMLEEDQVPSNWRSMSKEERMGHLTKVFSQQESK